VPGYCFLKGKQFPLFWARFAAHHSLAPTVQLLRSLTHSNRPISIVYQQACSQVKRLPNLFSSPFFPRPLYGVMARDTIYQKASLVLIIAKHHQFLRSPTSPFIDGRWSTPRRLPRGLKRRGSSESITMPEVALPDYSCSGPRVWFVHLLFCPPGLTGRSGPGSEILVPPLCDETITVPLFFFFIFHPSPG